MAKSGKYLKPSAPVAVGSMMMRIAAALICLVLISTHMMSGLYAKYTSRGTGSDSARVAAFDVNVTGTPDAVAVSCTESGIANGTYTLTVENQSEVAVRYTLMVTVTGDGAAAVVGSFDSSEGALEAGTTSKVHTLTFSVSDWSLLTQAVKGSSATTKSLKFTVTVNAEQVD